MATIVDLSPYCITQEEYDNPSNSDLQFVKQLTGYVTWDVIAMQFTLPIDKILIDRESIERYEIYCNNKRRLDQTPITNVINNQIWICKFTTISGLTYYYKFRQTINDNGLRKFCIYTSTDPSELGWHLFYGILVGMSIAPPNYGYVLK
jgi:hypothetical protein